MVTNDVRDHGGYKEKFTDNGQFKNLMYLKGALIESCMFCTTRSVGFLFLPSGFTRATTHWLAHSEIKKKNSEEDSQL